MRRLRPAGCVLVVFVMASSPAFAQHPLQDSASRAAAAAAAADAQTQPQRSHRATFWGGTILTLAGGTAIVLGNTTLKTADATSGNTPKGAYGSCVALRSNPVYRGNDCDVLKGPNTAVVIGGAIAAATGAALMLMSTSNNSVAFGPGGVTFRHRVKF